MSTNQMQFEVRRAIPGDEETVRTLRLAALSDFPSAFGSTYQREVNRTLEEWRQWLSRAATFILTSGGVPRGLAAGMHDEHDASFVHLRSMWVHKEVRGRGAADLLIAAVKNWAAEVGVRQVHLMVVEDNHRARACYERCGFRVTGKTTILERTGATEIEMSHDA